MVASLPLLRPGLIGVALLYLASLAAGCEVCDGATMGEDNVLELTADALDESVCAHELMLLLLYKSWSSRSDELRKQHVSAAAKLSGRPGITLARVDLSAHPSVAAQLQLADSEIPALRVLRGDASFGYAPRSGRSAGELAQAMLEEEVVQFGSLRRDAAAMAELEASSRTRVVASLSSAESIRAFEQVAAAYAGTITFAIVPPPPPPEGAAEADVEALEEVELFRERSADMEGECGSGERGSGGFGSSEIAYDGQAGRALRPEPQATPVAASSPRAPATAASR